MASEIAVSAKIKKPSMGSSNGALLKSKYGKVDIVLKAAPRKQVNISNFSSRNQSID